jgi:hypothetical protein
MERVIAVLGYVRTRHFMAGRVLWIVRNALVCLTLAVGILVAQSVSVKDFGAKGDGITDDRAAIQAAIDSPAASAVILPASKAPYLITPAPGRKTFLTLRSGVQLLGIGNPVLKVAPSAGPYDAVIAAEICQNCAVRSLTIDSNISHNPISGKQEIFDHPRFEISLRTARHVRIDDVTIQNSSSVNTVVTGRGSSDVRVANCTFRAIGDDPNHVKHDSSTLYIYSDGALIQANTFKAVHLGAPAAFTAIETHGSKMVVSSNIIEDYITGMNITGVTPFSSADNVVAGNTVTGALFGIMIWSHSYPKGAAGDGINGLTITGNTIRINQTAYAGALSKPSAAAGGIVVEPNSDLPVKNLVVSNNTVVFDLEKSRYPANSASLGIGWRSGLSRPAENWIIANNILVNGPVAGIRIAAELTGCRISGNVIRNAGSSLDTSITTAYKAPLFVAGAPATDVDISDNQIIDDLEPSRTRVALFLATTKGVSSGVTVRNNSVSILGANKKSFSSYLEIADDSTQPLIMANWKGFIASARKVAPGSVVVDSTTGTLWRANSDGRMLEER